MNDSRKEETLVTCETDMLVSANRTKRQKLGSEKNQDTLRAAVNCHFSFLREALDEYKIAQGVCGVADSQGPYGPGRAGFVALLSRRLFDENIGTVRQEQ